MPRAARTTSPPSSPASRRPDAGGLRRTGPKGGPNMEPVTNEADRGAREAAVSLLEEFKQFAFKGNVIDLAVGVIIGSAFGKIIDSLVKNVLMPLLSVLVP